MFILIDILEYQLQCWTSHHLFVVDVIRVKFGKYELFELDVLRMFCIKSMGMFIALDLVICLLVDR